MMDAARLEHVTDHMARLDVWAAVVVPIPLGLWRHADPGDVHHPFGYLSPGDAGVGRVAVFCPALIVASSHALDDFWFRDYLCTIETHLTLHAEHDLDEDEVRAELERLGPDSMVVARLVESGAFHQS